MSTPIIVPKEIRDKIGPNESYVIRMMLNKSEEMEDKRPPVSFLRQFFRCIYGIFGNDDDVDIWVEHKYGKLLTIAQILDDKKIKYSRKFVEYVNDYISKLPPYEFDSKGKLILKEENTDSNKYIKPSDMDQFLEDEEID